MERQIRVATPGSGIRNLLYPQDDGVTFVKNFEDYDVSTMTLVVLIDGHVKNRDILQYTVPVVGTYRSHQAVPGEITSYRWNGRTRGVQGGYFKNSPIVDICIKNPKVGVKTISTKISETKIQMCGCKSMDVGEEVGNYIVSQVNSVLDFVGNIESDKMLYMDASEWLLEHCKKQEGDSIVWPQQSDVPPEYMYFVTQIMMRCDDMVSVDQLEQMCDFFQTTTASCVATPIKLKKVGKSMVNYNYHLGFRVNRQVLYETLKDMGYYADFINTKRSSVTLEMYSNVDNDPDVIRKDNEPRSKQTFLIQLSGSVMHSGTGGAASKECYYHFASLMDSIRDIIEKIG
jgi:hypothetical protein